MTLISFEHFVSLLQCFTLTDLHSFDGSTLSTLNSSEFAEVSPVIVYCLLPAREKNSGHQRCQISPRNHSELYLSFARNYSHGKQVVTHHALEHIVEEINKTIGEFLTAKKVGDFVSQITQTYLPGTFFRDILHAYTLEIRDSQNLAKLGLGGKPSELVL